MAGVLALAVLAAASSGTDFGVRTLGAPVLVAPPSPAASSPTVGYAPLGAAKVSLASAAVVGSKWGRVTSTLRSPAHNKAVGGVPNSYHLRGRAIDIARRAGVTHSQIAAAFRAAGYQLVESLDEGDHSHFAFAWGSRAPRILSAPAGSSEVTRWGMVTVGGGR